MPSQIGNRREWGGPPTAPARTDTRNRNCKFRNTGRSPSTWAWPSWYSFRFPSPLSRAGTLQEMHHIVIVFVAGVFVHLLFRIDPHPRDARAPRSGLGGWIFHREFVIQ